MRGRIILVGLLLFALLSGCATRSSQTVVMSTGGVETLDETTTQQLLAIWQTRLCRYIVDAGEGDAEVLAELRRLRPGNVLRAARIRFGVLDVEAGAGRWDVQGVLVGRHRDGPFVRHVFMVGVVGHREYLSSEVRDLRLVAMAPVDSALVWEASARDRQALQRYRETFGVDAVSGFPAQADDFRLRASGTVLSVQESHSGAGWSLGLRPDLRDLQGAVVSDARSMPRQAGDQPCLPHAAGSRTGDTNRVDARAR